MISKWPIRWVGTDSATLPPFHVQRQHRKDEYSCNQEYVQGEVLCFSCDFLHQNRHKAGVNVGRLLWKETRKMPYAILTFLLLYLRSNLEIHSHLKSQKIRNCSLTDPCSLCSQSSQPDQGKNRWYAKTCFFTQKRVLFPKIETVTISTIDNWNRDWKTWPFLVPGTKK